MAWLMHPVHLELSRRSLPTWILQYFYQSVYENMQDVTHLLLL